MSTHHELLKAIVANYKEDTPRLAYADWLDEFGDCDRHAATAEFIRLSCSPRANPRPRAMPTKAYSWLRGNWRRLMPKVADMEARGAQQEIRFGTPEDAYWQGRWVEVRLAYGAAAEASNFPLHRATFPAVFEFWKGFCVCAHATPLITVPEFASSVLADQPLIAVPKRPVHYLTRASAWWVQDPDAPLVLPWKVQGSAP